MPDVRDVRALMDAAELAAGAGHYVAAREYLREAIALQEASIGPTHPDLANPLNNLGVVYEREGRPAEAEECYRRAYAIASAAFEPDHSSVVVSAKNLQEFCDANGRPFDASAESAAGFMPPAGPVPTPWSSRPVADAAGSGPPPGIPAGPATRTPSSTWVPAHAPRMGLLVFGGLMIGALIAIAAIAIFSRSGTDVPQSPEGTAAEGLPAAVSKGRTTPGRRQGTREQAARPATAAPVQTARSPAPAPTVADAELCRTLQRGDQWRCARATGALQPGVVFFYTRLLSSADTTVEHRWYRGDRLHQSVSLRVHANPRVGYRTYSQTTVSAARAGDWRVELRAADGTVLHQERFTVGR